MSQTFSSGGIPFRTKIRIAVTTQTVSVGDAANPITVTAAGGSDYAGHSVSGAVTATDAAGDQTTFGLATNGGPAHGSVSVAADGSYTYTANANYAGTDSFQVQVSDGHGGTTTQTVTVTDAANPISVATTGGAGQENAALSGHVVATDLAGDTMTYSLGGGQGAAPSHGSVTVNADGGYAYTPAANFAGTDSFQVQVSDGHGGTTTQTVSVTVEGPKIDSAAPASDYAGHSVSGTVTAHDVGGGNAITFSEGAGPADGSVVVHADGSYTYTANQGYAGTDSFQVVASDGHGGTLTQTVTVTDAANPITAATSGGSGQENAALTGHVTATDLAGDTMSYSLSTAQGASPAHGSVSVATDGSYTYTPAANFAGADSFQVTVSDGHGGTTTETVNVTVTDPGIGSTAIAASSVAEGGAVSIATSGHFSAVTGETLTYSASGLPAGVTINAQTGVISGIAHDAAFGTDAITVTATDSHNMTASQNVTLTVTDPGVASTTLGTIQVTNGQTLSVAASADFSTADAGDHLHFTAVLPTGLSIDATTGVISGTVSDAALDQLGGTSAGSTPITSGITEPTVINGYGQTTATTPVGPVVDGETGGFALTGNTVSGHVLAHDAAGDTMSYSLASGSTPAHGSVAVHADGSYTYTPGSGFVGTDSFTVQVSDGHGDTVNQAVQVNVESLTGQSHTTTLANASFSITGNDHVVDGYTGGSGSANSIVGSAWGANVLNVDNGLANIQHIQNIDLGYGGQNTILAGAGSQTLDFSGITVNHATILAGSGNDTITGGAGNEVFGAGSGTDTFIGGSGTNTYVLQSGDNGQQDTFIGHGSSNTIVDSAWGSNTLHVADGVANLHGVNSIDLGYGGNNKIVIDGTGSHHVDFSGITIAHATIVAGSGDDVIKGGNGNETFAAGAGADTFIGGTGANTYLLQSGDNGQTDTILGHGTANSIVDSAWGANVMHVADGLTNLSGVNSIDLGYGGHNTILAGGGSEVLNFSGITVSHATILAGSGNDTITGGAGNETFGAGSGTDTFIGGTGTNTYVLQSGDNGQVDTIIGHGSSNSIVDSAWGSNVMRVSNNLTNLSGVTSIDLGYGGRNTILVDDVKTIAVTATDDHGMTATQNLTVDINGGNTVTDFTGITVSHATIQAGAGTDTIIGGNGNETFGAGAGTDTFVGGTGTNTYVLQSGDNGQQDTFIGVGTSNSIVDGAWGANTLHVADGAANLHNIQSIDLGYGGNNKIVIDGTGSHHVDFSGITINHATIVAGSGNDVITGGAGNETFAAGTGADTFTGGTGNNTYILQSGDNGQTDTFIGAGSSNSIVDSAWGANVMHVADGLTNLTGVSSIDLGYGGHNTILAGGGDETLNFSGITVNHATILAGSGNDTIIGGAGNETFGAGSGTDTFTGGSGNNTYVLQTGDNGMTDTFIGAGTSNSIVDSAWGANVMHVDNNLTNLHGIGSIDLGYGGHNTILAGSGSQTLDFSGITVNHATILAGSGNDVITGGAGAETFGAGAGTDTFIGGSGGNTYVLQSGDNHQTDTFIGDHSTSNSIVDSAWGTNVMHVDNNLTNLHGIQSIDLGYGGHNTILAGSGSQTLDFSGITVNHATILAGSGNDVITGGAGAETFGAGAGTDTFIGGGGSNTYVLQSGDNGQTDTFIGHGTSNSIVDSAWGSNTLHVADGLANLQGVQSIDLGYGGHNTIQVADAGSGGQTLDFSSMTINHASIALGAGTDSVIMGANDTILAGQGNDLFTFGAHTGSSTVTGASGGGWTDTIDLHNIGTGATFDVSVLDASGHAVTNQSWTGQQVDSAVASDHTANLTSGEHGIITVHNTDGTTDHITFQNVEKITF